MRTFALLFDIGTGGQKIIWNYYGLLRRGEGGQNRFCLLRSICTLPKRHEKKDVVLRKYDLEFCGWKKVLHFRFWEEKKKQKTGLTWCVTLRMCLLSWKDTGTPWFLKSTLVHCFRWHFYSSISFFHAYEVWPIVSPCAWPCGNHEEPWPQQSRCCEKRRTE